MLMLYQSLLAGVISNSHFLVKGIGVYDDLCCFQSTKLRTLIKMPRKIRPPYNHERRWRDLNVDKNLKDDWLYSLNATKNFRVISTCEGYQNIRGRPPYPYVRL